jgi:DNA-binding MarR family transcriptional regulator
MHMPADLPSPATERLAVMQQVRLALLGVAEQLRQNWAAHAAAAGLSTAQVNALLSLTPGEAAPMRSLAARLDYDASNLSVLVDRLERRGVVERRPDPGDRRVKALALTPEGERLRATFWRELLEDQGPLAPLADSELAGLATLLGVLATDPVRSAAGTASPGRG